MLPKYPHQYYVEYTVSVEHLGRTLRNGDIVRLCDGTDEYVLTAFLKPRLLDGPNGDGGGIYAALLDMEKKDYDSKALTLVPIVRIADVVRHEMLSLQRRRDYYCRLQALLNVSRQSVSPATVHPAIPSIDNVAEKGKESNSAAGPQWHLDFDLPKDEPTSRAVSYLVSVGAHRAMIQANIAGKGKISILDALTHAASLTHRWGCSSAVCLSALLQSIYGGRGLLGTPSNTVPDRATVRSIIGEDAEELLWRLSGVAAGPDELHDFAALVNSAHLPHERVTISGVVSVATAGLVVRSALGEATVRTMMNSIEGVIEVLPPAARVYFTSSFGQLHHLNGVSGDLLKHDSNDECDDEATNPGLRTLLGLRDRAELRAYLQNDWSERMRICAVDSNVERLCFLPQSVDELLETPCDVIYALLHTDSGEHGIVSKDRKLARQLYEAGITLYFHNIQAPRLKRFMARVERELGAVRSTVSISAFASHRSNIARGTPMHHDSSDDYIVQLRGRKSWRIAPNTHVTFPCDPQFVAGRVLTKQQHVQAAPDRELPAEMPTAGQQLIHMTPGTVLFLPRGYWHETLSVNEESLHFNVESHTPAPALLLRFLLQYIPRAPALRLPLTDFYFQESPTIHALISNHAAFDRDGFLVPALREKVIGALRTLVRSVSASDLTAVSESDFGAFVGTALSDVNE